MNQQQTYLITGAAHGLGREITLELAAQNHKLILLDKDQRALNQLYDELEEKHPENSGVFLQPFDLTFANPDDYTTLTCGLNHQARIDGVFLNAASLAGLTPLENLEPKDWYETLQTNLNANFHLIQASLEQLKESNGFICAITDRFAKENPAYYGAYGVAKAGLEQLIKTLATEQKDITTHLFELEPMQGHFRSKAYPSENPKTLKTYEETAKKILETIYKY